MATRAVRYAVVDAFASAAFKGNPAAVCWLGITEEEEEQYGGGWMQSIAVEFNFMTTFVAYAAGSPEEGGAATPRFHLRWFTPVQEVKLCGHLTLAAAHFLFTSGLASGEVIEFKTKSGTLVAKKVTRINPVGNSPHSDGKEFSIELDFPIVPIVECDATEIPSIPKSLNGASIVHIKKTAAGDLLVELASGEEVADIQPDFDEIQQCAGRGILVTGLAHSSSGFDFFSRFFCPKLGIKEVNLCGHATLAAACFLLTSGVVKCNEIEFMTKSGLLMAKKYHGPKKCGSSKLSYDEAEDNFSIELDFPAVPFVECDASEIPSLPATLKGASVTSVQKTATDGDLIVELASGKDILDLKPVFDELLHCSKRGVIITGPAPPGSGFDFLTRFFCPVLGIDEDPVTGSIHCALAPYWSRKLGKHSLVAYQASPRGGILDLQWEEQSQRVLIRGEAVTVMAGTILV